MRAKPSSYDPIAPMDLANMRHNGVRSLAVQCRGCLHEVITSVDHLPGDCHSALVGAKNGVHEMRDHRRRRAAELVGESEAMKRPSTRKPSPPASKRVDLAADGVRRPQIGMDLVLDLEGAFSKCQWWQG
jgi:hypothetical protein